jgi:hypothetical protein
MTTNFERTAAWLTACGKTPSEETLSLQIGCHLEEFSEFLQTLNIESPTGGTSAACQEMAANLGAIAHNLKKGNALARIYDREQALDALCDSEVTGNGVAFLANMNKPAADIAVLDSNDDKLVDGVPVILEGGKIGKRPGWKAPDLTPFI